MMTDEMNEIKEFMGKFQRDYELKWGLYIDDELGDQIRVTILATGFGIDDVTDSDMMNQYTPEQNKQKKYARKPVWENITKD